MTEVCKPDYSVLVVTAAVFQRACDNGEAARCCCVLVDQYMLLSRDAVNRLNNKFARR